MINIEDIKPNTILKGDNDEILVMELTDENPDEYYCIQKKSNTLRMRKIDLNGLVYSSYYISLEQNFVLKKSLYNILCSFTKEHKNITIKWIARNNNSLWGNYYIYKIFMKFENRFLEIVLGEDEKFMSSLQIEDIYYIKEVTKNEIINETDNTNIIYLIDQETIFFQDKDSVKFYINNKMDKPFMVMNALYSFISIEKKLSDDNRINRNDIIAYFNLNF